MAREEFDWIDDAFDERKSQDRFGETRGSRAVGCLAIALVVALIFAFIGFAVIGALDVLDGFAQR